MKNTLTRNSYTSGILHVFLMYINPIAMLGAKNKNSVYASTFNYQILHFPCLFVFGLRSVSVFAARQRRRNLKYDGVAEIVTRDYPGDRFARPGTRGG